jgi:hypothetical protein
MKGFEKRVDRIGVLSRNLKVPSGDARKFETELRRRAAVREARATKRSDVCIARHDSVSIARLSRAVRDPNEGFGRDRDVLRGHPVLDGGPPMPHWVENRWTRKTKLDRSVACECCSLRVTYLGITDSSRNPKQPDVGVGKKQAMELREGSASSWP